MNLFKKEEQRLKNQIKLRKYKNKAILFLSITSFAFLMAFFGAIFNTIAIKSNGGEMPVKEYFGLTEHNPGHFGYSYSHQVNYPIFTDIFPLRTRNWLITFSLGDFLVILGLILASLMLLCESYTLFKFGIWKFGRIKKVKRD